MKTRSTSNYGTDSLGTEDASLNSSRYVRVTRRAAKARRQIMTKLTRQKGKKTKQMKQNLEADTESTEAKPRKTESACVLHKETTWGPFDEYDNEMTTLRHPKRRGPLMSPPPPRPVEDSDENPSQTQTQPGNPAATARRSGSNKYHPYIPEDVPALQADCLLRPKPTPPVDGLPLRKDLKGSVKGSNRISENPSDTTPSVTATQKQVKRKTVSRLGSLTKMSTAHKRPRQETVIKPEAWPRLQEDVLERYCKTLPRKNTGVYFCTMFLPPAFSIFFLPSEFAIKVIQLRHEYLVLGKSKTRSGKVWNKGRQHGRSFSFSTWKIWLLSLGQVNKPRSLSREI